MRTDNHPPEMEGAGYEKRDANPSALLISAVVLVATLVLTFILMVGTFKYFAATQSLGDPASPVTSDRVLPPLPRLQVDPRVDLRNFRQQERTGIESYGWVNTNGGTVKIPIERAMDLVLEKGFPIQAASPESEDRKLEAKK